MYSNTFGEAMTDLMILEQHRLKNLFKFIILFVLNTTVLIYYFIFGHYRYCVIPALFYLYSRILTIPMNFQKYVKRKFIQHINTIINNDGNIKWQCDNLGIYSNIAYKIDKKIEKQCAIEFDTSKYNRDEEYHNTTIILELARKKLENQGLSQEEQERLNAAHEYANKYNEVLKSRETQVYEVTLKMLNKIKNNKKSKNFKLNDLLKMEYLETKIEQFEKQMLYKKNIEEKEQLFEKLSHETKYENMKNLNDKIDLLSKEITKYEENYKTKIDKKIAQDNIFEVLGKYKDLFYGNYKNVKDFIAMKYNGRNLKGTIIKIPIDKNFKNVIFIQNKSNSNSKLANMYLKSGLSIINLDRLNNKYKIFARSQKDIECILNNEFIQYLNEWQYDFSYLFRDNNAYLILENEKDSFNQVGSLYKKVNNIQENESITRDIISLLCAVNEFVLCMSE